MINLIKLKMYFKIQSKGNSEYKACVVDMINSPVVQSMEKFIQHSDISCFEHCINVSYNSYLICMRLGLDYRAAARGGLVHDLFLYDWHCSKPEKGLHGLAHPLIALENANKHFDLNDKEKDIIEKHMWPLTLKLPKYKESLIVCLVDKYCAFMEFIKAHNGEYICRIEEYVRDLNEI
jgi:uncharacterized protein